MGSIAGFTAQQTSDFTFGLTEPLLTSKCLKFGDDRLDNVDLGRSSGTDLRSGGREFGRFDSY